MQDNVRNLTAATHIERIKQFILTTKKPVFHNVISIILVLGLFRSRSDVPGRPCPPLDFFCKKTKTQSRCPTVRYQWVKHRWNIIDCDWNATTWLRTNKDTFSANFCAQLSWAETSEPEARETQFVALQPWNATSCTSEILAPKCQPNWAVLKSWHEKFADEVHSEEAGQSINGPAGLWKAMTVMTKRWHYFSTSSLANMTTYTTWHYFSTSSPANIIKHDRPAKPHQVGEPSSRANHDHHPERTNHHTNDMRPLVWNQSVISCVENNKGN